MTIAAQNRTPQAGELVKLRGSELAVVLRQEEDFVPFIPLVSINKDGSRSQFFVKPESIGEPHLGRISSRVAFYDACMRFYDGAANCDSESEIDTMIAAVRDDAFALAAEAAHRVRDFEAPCNMARQRVCLDFAKRTGVDPAKIEEDRQKFEAARLQAEASGHVPFDPANFFRELRKRGCNPEVIGRGHDVSIAHTVGPGSKPGDLFGDAMEADTDGDLRFDYARAVWAARTPGAFGMPLGV